MFRAEVMRKGGAWVVIVKGGRFYHNHVVSPEVFDLYPESRRILPDDPLMATVRAMALGESKPHVVYEYIRKNSDKKVKMQDVHNLLAKIRRESTGGVSDDVLAVEKMLEFQLKDDGNVVSLEENSKGYIGVLSFTTKMMRQLVHRFSEVLLVDCTHRVNR
jgi:glycosylphosphatidylinositol transamidase (GPIT) subunit GPI8